MMSLVFAFATLTSTTEAAKPALIPWPTKVVMRTGEFVLGSGARIVAPPETRHVAEWARGVLRASTGFPLDLARGERNAIRYVTDKTLAPEGYRLTVDANGVVIRSATAGGALYGTHTLLQLLPPDVFRRSRVDGVRWTIPAVEIEDAPRFSWRGGMIDSSRHFMPKEFILKFIDLLAMHKLNVFHWHLTDDNGWRIEIKRYPKLTELGSKSDFSAMNPGGATRSINQRPEGFYTQEDVREIVRYAAERNVTVVPEIEMPGHSNAAILAYPELGNRRQILESGGDASFMGSYDNVYNVEESTIQFLQHVLDEVISLFPSKFIHIGGDEVWKEPWKRNPKAQAKMRQLGLKNEEELQSWFIRRFDDYLASKGRRLIGWDEILEGGLAPGAAVMSWRSMEGGIHAAKAGHDVVMAPTSHTYLDYYQARLRAFEPRAIGGYLPLETVYGFEPVPTELTPAQSKHIMGAQAQLWSEYIPHPKHMEYMAYPRLTALSEVAWSQKDARDWTDFQRRLQTHLRRLDVLDVNYRRPSANVPKPIGGWKSGEVGETWIERDWDVTSHVSSGGEYQVIFAFSGGGHRLDIARAALLQDGVEVAVDEHEGMTGHADRNSTYRLRLPNHKPGARYTLRARIRADGGNDSNGDVYFVPAR